MGGVIAAMVFPHPPREHSAHRLRNHPSKIDLQCPTAGKTPAIHLQNPQSDITLLVTHGNAEDLGESLDGLQNMMQSCNVSIFAVEYPGYSISEAKAPSEAFCLEAVETAYNHLVDELKIDASRIVPYGRSLGSGPAVHVASIHPEIKGLVLISPLESGARAVFGKVTSSVGYPLDPFKNYRKIGYVQARTCIVHGTDDTVVPCHNGRALHAALEKRSLAATPKWIEGYGHNDMPEHEVLRHVKAFLDAEIRGR
jgi:hypothetical protein